MREIAYIQSDGGVFFPVSDTVENANGVSIKLQNTIIKNRDGIFYFPFEVIFPLTPRLPNPNVQEDIDRTKELGQYFIAEAEPRIFVCDLKNSERTFYI